MKQFLTLDYLLHFGMLGPLVSFLGFYILNIQITNLTLFIYRNIYTQQNKSELIIHITYKVACVHVVTTDTNRQALDFLNGIKSVLTSGEIYLEKSKTQRSIKFW